MGGPSIPQDFLIFWFFSKFFWFFTFPWAGRERKPKKLRKNKKKQKKQFLETLRWTLHPPRLLDFFFRSFFDFFTFPWAGRWKDFKTKPYWKHKKIYSWVCYAYVFLCSSNMSSLQEPANEKHLENSCLIPFAVSDPSDSILYSSQWHCHMANVDVNFVRFLQAWAGWVWWRPLLWRSSRPGSRTEAPRSTTKTLEIQ